MLSDIIFILSGFLTIIGVISVLLGVVNFIKAKQLEQQLNLTGDYITEYETLEDGKSVTRKAIAQLKQKGSKLTGTTHFDSLKQEWAIDAKIFDSAHVSGVYKSLNTGDKNYGNFFLNISPNRVLEGMWAGYNDRNKLSHSGKYTFHPMYKNYSIELASHDDMLQIIDLAENSLGKNFVTYDAVSSALEETSSSRIIVAVEKNTEKRHIIGFMFGFELNHDELVEQYKDNKNEIPHALLHEETVGLIRTTSVKPEFRRRGIARAMFKEMESRLSKDGIHAIVALGWHTGTKVNIHTTVNALDYKKSIEIENYWLDDTKSSNIECATCGDECHCTAIFYYKVY